MSGLRKSQLLIEEVNGLELDMIGAAGSSSVFPH
jgi:hypothetical protein